MAVARLSVDQVEFPICCVCLDLELGLVSFRWVDFARWLGGSASRKANSHDTGGSIVNRILRPVGHSVSFNYPAGEKHKRGILIDRAVVQSNPRTRGVPYWDVVDLIEFKNDKRSKWIRIGYYRVPKGRLQWGSQTTITEPVKTWKRVLVKAAKKKPWFRDLLMAVAIELRN